MYNLGSMFYASQLTNKLYPSHLCLFKISFINKKSVLVPDSHSMSRDVTACNSLKRLVTGKRRDRAYFRVKRRDKP